MKYYLIALLTILLTTPLFAQTAEDANTLHEKGRVCLEKGNIKEGRELTLQALQTRKKLFGEVNEDYITSLNNYACTFWMDNDLPKALELQKQVVDLCNKLSKPHPKVATYTENLGKMYFEAGEMDNAIVYLEQALPLVEKYSDSYVNILGKLGDIYMNRNDAVNFKRILALAMENDEYQLFSQPCNDPECLSNQAEYFYSAKGDKAKAKELYLQALGMDLTTTQKIDVYSSYAKFLESERDFSNSADYYFMAAENLLKFQNDLEKYDQLLSKAALNMYFGKKFQKASDYYNTLISFNEKLKTPESEEKIAHYRQIHGNVLASMYDFDQAENEYRKSLEYYSSQQQGSENHASLLECVAMVKKLKKDYDSAIQYYKEAIDLYNKLGMPDKAHNAKVSLDMCYGFTGKTMENEDDKEAEKLKFAKLQQVIDSETSVLELTRQILGESQYASSIAVIGGCYAQMGKFPEAVDYYKQYLPALRDALRNDFLMMDESERMILWDRHLSNIEQIMELLATLPAGCKDLMPDLSSVAYDCMLLSKGILLNSSIEFEKVISSSGNDKLKEKYKQIKLSDEEINNKRLTATTDDDLQNILNLQQKNRQLKLQLYKACAEYADFTDFIGYDWKNVQSQLKDDDAAIEFAVIKPGIFDEDNYLTALVLTKEMTSPAALPVCTIADIKQINDNNTICDNPTYNNFIWGRLADFIDGKRNIYFSADGDVNKMGIEYLQYNGKPLSEQKNVYRLSTTKQLCYSQPKHKNQNAVLFGDINYYTLTEEKPSEQTQQELDKMRASHSLSADDIVFDNLPNTRREIDEISKLLKSDNVDNVVPLFNKKATADTFLSLDGKKVNILHISTHGAFLAGNGNDEGTDAMKRSILAFAGASTGYGTGIISADDIAKMNLRDCNLAVLSACETGLGEIGSDGVFGLQRGFKNAGVRTLLMSLRNVYDAATTELMIQFYRSLIAGETPNQALRSAQKYLRNNGYDKPQYWAPFIVLDGQE